MDLLERWIVVCPEHGPAHSVSKRPLGQGCWYWSTDDTHCKAEVEEVRLTNDQGAVDALRLARNALAAHETPHDARCAEAFGIIAAALARQGGQ